MIKFHCGHESDSGIACICEKSLCEKCWRAHEEKCEKIAAEKQKLADFIEGLKK